MKKLYLLFVSILFVQIIYSQYQITIDAFIIDQATNNPIEYVNIGFVNRSIGTVSDGKGYFKFSYDENLIHSYDVLRFSILGYESLELKASQLTDFFTNNTTVYLIPSPLDLKEVVITYEKRNVQLIGNHNYNDEFIGYWKDKKGLGGEIATRIKIKNEESQILNVTLNVIENVSDSIKIRINVFDVDKGLPGEKLLKYNVYKTIKEKQGQVSIDLEPYNLFVDDDVIISLELIDVFGDKLAFVISANDDRGPSHFREISQSEWTTSNKNGINISALISYPIGKNKSEIIERRRPSRLTIYWDVSLNMNHSLKINELELLSAYLSEIGSVSLEVIKFNNTIIDKKEFIVKDGESKDIIEYLKDSFYQGVSDYDLILKSDDYKSDAILLFTDGKSPFSSLNSEFYKPIFIINSLKSANHSQLQDIANYSDGHYIFLSNIKIIDALELMLKETEDEMIYKNSYQDKEKFSGQLKLDTIPLEGATVTVKNSFIETKTDKDGNFTINGSEGDILVFDYLGLEKIEVTVGDQDKIDVKMNYHGELLAPVFLKSKKAKQDSLRERIMKRLKMDGLGPDSPRIFSEDIEPHHITITDILSGRFPGLTIMGTRNDPQILIRGNSFLNSSNFAVFDLDGIVYRNLPPVNINEIEVIGILSGLSKTVRYGDQGRNGVIAIRTKNFVGNTGKARGDRLQVKNNLYNEQVIDISDLNKSNSYLTELTKAYSFENAKDIYRKQMKDSKLAVDYYLEVADYFKKWDKRYSTIIISNIGFYAENNVKALKTLAYKLEELEDYSLARKIYLRLLELRPDDSQSYRDLARINVDAGFYEEAMSLYKKILSDKITNVDFSGLQEILANEFKHFLLNHRSKIDFSNIPPDYLSAKFKKDVRIVLSWNDPNAEFEIQFVNPENKYYSYLRSRNGDLELIDHQILTGYNTKEYIIDNEDYGKWIINLKSDNNDATNNPVYIKYTRYKNYGQSDESKMIKVVNLTDLTSKVTIDDFNNYKN